jgi:hypothetical protein
MKGIKVTPFIQYSNVVFAKHIFELLVPKLEIYEKIGR